MDRRSGVTIREARSEDAERIHEVLATAFHGLHERGYGQRALATAIPSPAEIRERITAGGGHVLIAESEGGREGEDQGRGGGGEREGRRIVGTATGIEEHGTLHAYSVAVLPDWRRQGIASRLIAGLESIARRRGCHKLWVETAWAMTEGIVLFKRLGYLQEGYQPRHLFGEDLLVFSKVLEEEAVAVADGAVGGADVEPAAAPGAAAGVAAGAATGRKADGAILLYPGVEELDFVGVFEILTKARTVAAEEIMAAAPPPQVQLLARESRVPCANGLVVQPHRRYAGLAGFDFVIVPGGRGVHALRNDEELLAELRRFQQAGGLVCSVCTGALVLAWAGLLEGRRATTHHAHRKKLAAFCEVLEDRVVSDENVLTAAGVSASLDLGLALLERLCGPEMAQQVAQRVEYRC